MSSEEDSECDLKPRIALLNSQPLNTEGYPYLISHAIQVCAKNVTLTRYHSDS